MDWTDPTWLDGAHAWIEQHVIATGTTEQFHVRPWSTVLRVPTERGDVYFKANDPRLQFEAGLVMVLAARRADCIPPLVALDFERGWMLMEDAGTRLRELVAEERDLSRWLEILPLYASVQLDAVEDVPAMLAAGTPDLRLAVLPDMYEQLLEDVPELAHEDARLREAIPRVRTLCDELAAFGLPETINHDDFHDGQVYVRNGRYLLLDWGDACVTHPFFTLAVTLGGVLSWGLDDIQHSLDVTPFLDAYLEPFGAELKPAADIALQLGWICRAVNAWHGGATVPETQQRLAMFFG
jgi:hypothetical protein